MNSNVLRALLVDDDSSWQRIYSFYLESEGFVTQVANNKENAIKEIDANIYDIAVIDLRLVDKDERNWDGIEVARYLRKSQPKVRLIIKSGFLDARVKHELGELHPEGIFDKGNPIEEFVQLIKTIKGKL